MTGASEFVGGRAWAALECAGRSVTTVTRDEPAAGHLPRVSRRAVLGDLAAAASEVFLGSDGEDLSTSELLGRRAGIAGSRATHAWYREAAR